MADLEQMWRVDRDGARHVVQLRHDELGAIEVSIDGIPTPVNVTKGADGTRSIGFMLGRAPARVIVFGTDPLTYDLDLDSEAATMHDSAPAGGPGVRAKKHVPRDPSECLAQPVEVGSRWPRVLAVLVVLALLGAGALFAPAVMKVLKPNRWRTFHAGAARFSVDFPDTPSISEEADGETISTTLDADSYVAHYADLPRSKASNPQRVLDSARERVAKGSRLIDSRTVDVQGSPGLEMNLQSDAGYARERVIVIGQKLVELKVTSKFTLSGDADRFFGSFETM